MSFAKLPALFATVFLATSLLLRSADENLSTPAESAEIEVVQKNDEVTCTIASGPTKGIGSAVLKRTGEKWPEPLVIRLHLSGLESLQLKAGKITLRNSVSSSPDHRYMASLFTDDQKEKILKPESPYWSPVRMVAKKKTIPLKSGFFEYTVPPKFIEQNPQTIEIRWIDFYR